MSAGKEKRRPLPGTANLETTDAQSTRLVRRAPELEARSRQSDHGIRVIAERADGVVTSQVYANLRAAERKVQRTRERGLCASLVLVRIVPTPMAPMPSSLLQGEGA